MRDPAVDLWALDEVHFQQHGSRCRMWVPPEVKDPVLYHHPTRRSVGYFGAVRLQDGLFYYRQESRRFNGETFLEFMEALRAASVREGRRVVVISDNAKYHRAKLHLPWRQQHGADFRFGFSATLQSGPQPDRKSLETHAAAVPSPSLFRIPQQCRRRGRGAIQSLDEAQ